jgi:hypothetical protein
MRLLLIPIAVIIVVGLVARLAIAYVIQPRD